MSGVLTMLLGPITGIAGSTIGTLTKWLEHRQRMAELERQQAHEIRLQELNIQARGQELEQEALIAQTQAHADAMAASYRHDASAGQTHKWVASALRLMRPLFTLLLIVLAGAIYFFAQAEDAVEGKPLREHVALTVLYLTEVAVTWWFADRARGSR